MGEIRSLRKESPSHGTSFYTVSPSFCCSFMIFIGGKFSEAVRIIGESPVGVRGQWIRNYRESWVRIRSLGLIEIPPEILGFVVQNFSVLLLKSAKSGYIPRSIAVRSQGQSAESPIELVSEIFPNVSLLFLNAFADQISHVSNVCSSNNSLHMFVCQIFFHKSKSFWANIQIFGEHPNFRHLIHSQSY